MNDVARLFIAVKIEPTRPLRKVLSQLEAMGRAVKPIAADKLHLTLKFLGDTDLALVPQVSDFLRKAVGEATKFEMPLVGLGAFPHPRRPSVVWVGTQESETLVDIAGSLERLLRPLGFKRERRRFEPHVTLARIRSKPPGELAELLDADQSTDFGAVPVASVQLFQSELRSDGPQYTVLSTVELADI